MKLLRYELPLEVREQIQEKLPKSIIKKLETYGNKEALSYVSGCVIIDILNIATGYNWEFEVLDSWIRETPPTTDKKTGNPKEQPPVAHVRARITLHFIDADTGNDIAIRKESFGSKTVIGGADKQQDIFKSAQTDAIKKAASLFGIGAQLWRDKSEQDYFEEISYVDPWTDEAKAAHKEEFDYIDKLIKDKVFTREELEDEISDFTAGQAIDVYEMEPQELTDFVKALKDSEASEVA